MGSPVNVAWSLLLCAKVSDMVAFKAVLGQMRPFVPHCLTSCPFPTARLSVASTLFDCRLAPAGRTSPPSQKHNQRSGAHHPPPPPAHHLLALLVTAVCWGVAYLPRPCHDWCIRRDCLQPAHNIFLRLYQRGCQDVHVVQCCTSVG